MEGECLRITVLQRDKRVVSYRGPLSCHSEEGDMRFKDKREFINYFSALDAPWEEALKKVDEAIKISHPHTRPDFLIRAKLRQHG